MVSDPPEGVVCDLDGVVYRGEDPIEGSAEAIERMRDRGMRFLFCSNNSNTTVDGYRAKLARFGVDADRDEILTSGVVLSHVLRREVEPGATVFCVGGKGLREAVDGAGLRAISDRDADVVVVGWDLDFTYEAMRTAAHALDAGAAFYASNSDASFPAPDGKWPGTGAILAAIETASGRRAEVVGKPHAPMRDLAAERLAGCERIGVVGDRADTDIALGLAMGWQTALVLSGITEPGDVAHLRFVPDEIAGTLAEVSWAQ